MEGKLPKIGTVYRCCSNRLWILTRIDESRTMLFVRPFDSDKDFEMGVKSIVFFSVYREEKKYNSELWKVLNKSDRSYK